MSSHSDLIKLSWPQTQDFWKIPVLFEDPYLLALDKPSRLLTSPDRYDADRPNLMRLLHRDIERAAPWTVKRGITYLANAHRLDFETSGCLLLAKTKPALISLANEFGAEKPHKTYLALIHGAPSQASFEVKAKLGPHPLKTGLNRVDEKGGKRASTAFRLLESFSGYSLMECTPFTGRTHQIRVHLQYVGLPIVGDALYGGQPLQLSRLKPNYTLKHGREETPLMGRVALHAQALSILHPETHDPVRIESPLPHDFEVALKYLRRYAGTPAPQFAKPAP